MEGAFAKKKEYKAQELAPQPKKASAPKVSPFDHAQIMAEKKSQPPVSKPVYASLSMSEGPMLLKTIEESKKVEVGGRKTFERSVKIELDALRGKKKKRRKKGKGKKRKQEDPPKK